MGQVDFTFLHDSIIDPALVAIHIRKQSVHTTASRARQDSPVHTVPAPDFFGGGPLFDDQGHLAGVIVGSKGAVPISQLRPLLDKLAAAGGI